MSWTSPNDVLDAWIGADAPTDVDALQIWIDKAEREIRFRVPDIQERLDTEAELLPPADDLLETAKDVVTAMVARIFRNPEGIRQTNMTAGSYTESKTYGGNQPGGLGLTDDELAKLQGVLSAGAFTVSMIPLSSRFYAGAPNDW